MKQLTGDDAFKFYFVSFGAALHIWLIVGAFVALAVLGLFEDDTIALIALVVVPILLSYKLSKDKLSKINAAFNAMTAKVKETLPRIDYLNTGEYGCIGVDADSKTIAVVSADKNFKVGKPYRFGAKNIKNYQAFSPGFTELVAFRARSFSYNEVVRQNLIARAEAEKKTGLYFILDDLANPLVFVQMPYDEAEEWVLIIDKLIDGTLEKQSNTLVFPLQ